MRYNLNIKANAKYHHPEGRCIILQFNSYYLISLLSPVQGWINRSVRIRSRWDRELATFLNNSKSEKATIITGCLNCAPQDIDLSDPERLKQEKSIVLHKQEEIGFPGSRDVDREGFKWLLDAGNMTDVFRVKHPYDGTAKTEKNIKFTTLAFLSDKTRCAVRTNLVLMSKNFLRNVKFCEIIGNVNDLNPSGWRHLPQLLKLEKK
ncbi:DNA-(apurinic or apyrimidinic site) lyase [Theileria parva strain Muguga]|uniref:DNA-(apurinic or apyrimidinic site) lyase n=1 Tax=Theileria parva strain Muguga TaxID=333668 RepID=UPI001C617653|nr:DNA-(apurinic or apyrimidinic site) lyase [Theileria parva strain Muguga]KAF5153074.1 DNA-(apurinic or apyrimidinic site) lyase [Theileria parva strain Muguga]